MYLKNSSILAAFAATCLFGLIQAETSGSKDLFRCRQNCYQKVKIILNISNV